MKKTTLFLLATLFVVTTQAQLKTVFNRNLTFAIPAGWYMKDSSDKRVMLRKTDDQYSKLEIKIYEHKEKDLAKYVALDKKKFFPDKHSRTVLPDVNLGSKLYKRIKYVNSNKVVIANSEVEYAQIWKPKLPLWRWAMARIEVIITYGSTQEAAMLKAADALVASFKYF